MERRVRVARWGEIGESTGVAEECSLDFLPGRTPVDVVRAEVAEKGVDRGLPKGLCTELVKRRERSGGRICRLDQASDVGGPLSRGGSLGGEFELTVRTSARIVAEEDVQIDLFVVPERERAEEFDVVEIESPSRPAFGGDGEEGCEVEGARDDDTAEDAVIREVGLKAGADPGDVVDDGVGSWDAEPRERPSALFSGGGGGRAIDFDPKGRSLPGVRR